MIQAKKLFSSQNRLIDQNTAPNGQHSTVGQLGLGISLNIISLLLLFLLSNMDELYPTSSTDNFLLRRLSLSLNRKSISVWGNCCSFRLRNLFTLSGVDIEQGPFIAKLGHILVAKGRLCVNTLLWLPSSPHVEDALPQLHLLLNCSCACKREVGM